MQVERVPDAASFLDRSAGLRAQEPLLTNVVGSVAQLAAGGRVYEQAWWWLVRDDGGAAVGCAMRTAPWNLTLGPMPGPAAAALAAAVAEADPHVPGVTGPDVVVQAFASALSGGRRLEVTMRDVVHVLGTLVEPVGVPGEVVVARPDEMAALLAWHEQFAIDAGLPVHDMESSIRARLDAGALLWWAVDGEHVSLAGHTQPVAVPGGSVGRIGPVFTPRPHRRHGYAGALTAAVVRRMLPRCSTVMLLADTANATSNGVYERLGFRPVAEVVEARLMPG